MGTLVISLMGTFCHQVADPNEPYDMRVLETRVDNEKVSSLVRFTDGFSTLVQQLAASFDIIVYENGSPELVNQLVSYFDPQGRFVSYCIYSNSCFAGNMPELQATKDLRVVLNRKPETMRYLSASFDLPYDQLSNFVPVLPSRLLATPEQCKDHTDSLLRYLMASEASSGTDHFGLKELASLAEARDELIKDFIAARCVTASPN